MADPQSFNKAIDAIFTEAKTVMLAKRVARGTGNISTQGIPGVIDRMILDKGARLRTASVDMAGLAWLRSKGIQPANIPELQLALEANGSGSGRDGFEDDLIDIINYSIIALCLSRGWWEKPLETAAVDVSLYPAGHNSVVADPTGKDRYTV